MQTLAKSIEILDDLYIRGYKLTKKEQYAALQLGIEAMKQRLEYNHKNLIDFSVLLPGETEE